MARSEITLLIGGASSGKSLLAERLAGGSDLVTYIATALPADDEMRSKIKIHQNRRPRHWRTIEVSCPELVDVLGRTAAEVIIIDSLTLYVAGALSVPDPDGHMLDVIYALGQISGNVIVVSDEVGLGIVPESAGGRAFRDFLGRTNQRLAAAADNVYFVTAGLPSTLKGSAINLDTAWA